VRHENFGEFGVGFDGEVREDGGHSKGGGGVE
jgi:hypothetical protein